LQEFDRRAVAVELQSCLNCFFVQTKLPFSDEAISRLYGDYRPDSYNKERSHYEPTYAAVAKSIDSHTEAGLERVEALTSWLQGRINLDEGTILDFGGADGKFLPTFHGHKYVMRSQMYNLLRASRVLRADLGFRPILTFSLPTFLSTSQSRPSLVQEGGYLLFEVPQAVSIDILQQLQLGHIPCT
jgi:hypothetical protein